MRRSSITITITTAFAMIGALAGWGCGGKSAPPIEARLPQVAAAAALAASDAPLPVAVVLLDETGAMRVAPPPPSWTVKLPKVPKRGVPVDADYLRQIAGELRAGMPLAAILRAGPSLTRLEPILFPDEEL